MAGPAPRAMGAMPSGIVSLIRCVRPKRSSLAVAYWRDVFCQRHGAKMGKMGCGTLSFGTEAAEAEFIFICLYELIWLKARLKTNTTKTLCHQKHCFLLMQTVNICTNYTLLTISVSRSLNSIQFLLLINPSSARSKTPACTTSPAVSAKPPVLADRVRCTASNRTKATPPMLAAPMGTPTHCASSVGRNPTAKLHVPKWPMFRWVICPIPTFESLVVGNAPMAMRVCLPFPVPRMATAILSCDFRAATPCCPVNLLSCRRGSCAPFNTPASRSAPGTPVKSPVVPRMLVGWPLLPALPTTPLWVGSLSGTSPIATYSVPCRTPCLPAIFPMGSI